MSEKDKKRVKDRKQKRKELLLAVDRTKAYTKEAPPSPPEKKSWWQFWKTTGVQNDEKKEEL